MAMCEKRAKKMLKRGSHEIHLREARRLKRIQRMAPAAYRHLRHEASPQYSTIAIDKAVYYKLILKLTQKTIVLVQNHIIIQQKLAELNKETPEYVAANNR